MSSETNLTATQTIALGIQYFGPDFSGWQLQARPPRPTVQDVLQQALSFVADHAVTVVCAGRTDAGVHCAGQVVSFQTQARRPLTAWVQGVNSRLPDTVSVAWAKVMPADFHARFSATARRYQYFILNSPVRKALAAGRFSWYSRKLDAELMQQAGQVLLGEQDFSSFRGAGCQSRSPNRHVFHLKVYRHSDVVVIDIKANAFVLHMVRNIVGSLLEVGSGQQPPQWLQQVLLAKDRTMAGATAAADGLYLVEVDYPEKYHLPAAPPLQLLG